MLDSLSYDSIVKWSFIGENKKFLLNFNYKVVDAQRALMMKY